MDITTLIIKTLSILILTIMGSVASFGINDTQQE
jgi:hypothetical protein